MNSNVTLLCQINSGNHKNQYVYKMLLIINGQKNCRQIPNISRALLANKFDHTDVVGASPVAAAPTASSSWT